MAKKSEKPLRVTLTKSTITSNKKHKATVRALGLKRLNHTVEHADNPVIRGMIAKVSHLVTVEEG
jgi:large subunit ribosomal protein L30